MTTSRFRLLASLVLLAVVAGGCRAGSASSEPSPSEDPVRVGAGPDAESLLLGAVMVELLTASGLRSELVEFSDAQDARQALELRAIDVRPGYTGETWLEQMGRADPPGDAAESYLAVRDFDRDDDILWLRPPFADEVSLDAPPANATFTFVVRGPPAIDADLRTMSQLATRLSERPAARVCVDEEFGTRPDGLQAVLDAYSVRTDVDFLAADPEEAVLGVVAGDCIAGLTTTTDGDVWRSGLIPLIDDLGVFPAFVPLPQVHAEAADRVPDVLPGLAPLPRHLTTRRLGEWNARVADGEPLDLVAADAAARLLELAGRSPPPSP